MHKAIIVKEGYPFIIILFIITIIDVILYDYDV